MAKVTAPLFSFSASGQLGGALVYFNWKGLQVVRTYSVPSNPNTAAQQSQRTAFAAAVDAWHDVGLDADDVSAWNRYAATFSSPRSGFNAFVKDQVDIDVAGYTPNMGISGGVIDSSGGQFDCTVTEDGAATAADCVWGYTPTALNNTQALSEVANVWSATNVPATAGSRVYARFVLKTGGNITGRTGIFTDLLA